MSDNRTAATESGAGRWRLRTRHRRPETVGLWDAGHSACPLPPILRALLLLGLLAALSAQPAVAVRDYRPVSPDPMEEPWRWRLFPELADGGLRCLAEAPDGTLWAGTDGGTRRYAGSVWSTIPTDHPVNALLTTSSGALWVGTDRGIFRLEGETLARIFPGDPNLPWPVDELVEDPQGTVWAATGWGALQLAADGARLFTSSDMATALAEIMPGLETIEIPGALLPVSPSSPGPGLSVVSGGFLGHRRGSEALVVWHVVPGSPAAEAGIVSGDRLVSIDGEEGSHRLDGDAGTELRLRAQRRDLTSFEDFVLPRALLQSSAREAPVYDLLVGDDGELWLGLVHGEILRCRGCLERSDQPVWDGWGPDEGLVLGPSPRLARTPNGDIWEVTDGAEAGFQRFDGERWHTLELGGPAERIHTSILVDDDGVLWASGMHLFRYADGEWSILTSSRSPFELSRARLFPASDGSIWLAGREQGAAELRTSEEDYLSLSALAFQTVGADGSRWFLGSDLRVVREGDGGWQSFGIEDGIVESPTSVFTTRDGRLWVVGSQRDEAAVSIFDDGVWRRVVLPSFARSVSGSAILEDSEGTLWLGGFGDLVGRGGGLVRLPAGRSGRSEDWELVRGGAVPLLVRCLTEAADGTLWAAGNEVAHLRGESWEPLAVPFDGPEDSVHSLHVDTDGSLLLGVTGGRIFSFHQGSWTRNQLPGDRLAPVHRFFERRADRLHALSGSRTYLRREGDWYPVFYPVLVPDTTNRLEPRVEAPDAVWANAFSPGGLPLATVRLRVEERPPETRIVTGTNEVSWGNPAVSSWAAEDPWHDSPLDQLRYSWRLDGGSWSPFSPERQSLFLNLGPGEHLLEVRSADSFLNVDPTPARFAFRVVPPLWRRLWFQLSVAAILALLLFQQARILGRNRSLLRLNQALEESRNALEERVAERTSELAESTRQLQEEVEERIETEEALRRSEHRYRTFVASSLEGIGRIEIEPPMPVDLPLDLQLVWMREHARLAEGNQVLAKSLGLTQADQLVDRLPPIVLDLADRPQAVLEAFTHRYQMEAVESMLEVPGEPPRTFLDTLSGEVIDQHLVRLWWTRTEVTERRQAELATERNQRELARIDRMISLGTLVSGVAHEINNPNQFLMLNLPVLREAWRDAIPLIDRAEEITPGLRFANMPWAEARDEITDLLDEVLEGSHRIKAIVADLRNYAREDGAPLEGRVVINETVRSSLRLLGNTLSKATDHFTVDYGDDLPDVRGNVRQIEQVVINLVLNACQALESRDQEISVRTEWDEGSGEVVTSVRDGGRGIAPEDLPHVTDPFFTRKRDVGGSGLGLSVAARIVAEHGGRLVFESSPGEGTTVRLHLPPTSAL